MHIEQRTQAAIAWARTQEVAIEAALAALVDENSFTANIEGGNRVGRALQALFECPELRCDVTPSQTYADHRVFSTGAAGPSIILVGHLDTVFPPGTFEGYRRVGDVARGPGVLDMKGGLLVAGFALLALRHVELLDTLAVQLAIVSDEEVGSPEGQKMLETLARNASCGLVFEAGRQSDAIVTRRKGVGSITAVATGKAAHAGNLHHQGVNAIWALARFIDAAQKLTDYANGTTVNVGQVVGGDARNTVPDSARAELDLRFTSREEAERLLARLTAEAATAAANVPGAALELQGGISRLPLESSADSERLFREYAACALGSGLGALEAPLVGGGSDANTLSGLRVPCIDALGPRGLGFHTKDEQIEFSSILPKIEALVRFLAGRSAAASQGA